LLVEMDGFDDRHEVIVLAGDEPALTSSTRRCCGLGALTDK